MAKSRKEIIADINEYMKGFQYKNSDWYVGIATDPTVRLFNDHNVTEKGGHWIYRLATSDSVAREVEQAYLDAGYDGGDGGGDENTKSVYAYVKLKGTVR